MINNFTGVRSPSKVLEKYREEKLEGSYEALELDTSSLESVRQFANKVLAKNVPIHVLLNNAGIMFGPRKDSKDGFEGQLATNHLGHFLLTHLLFPRLKEAGSRNEYARIVNVSSAAHFGGFWTNWEDLMSKFVHSFFFFTSV